jgi:tetratricopeptide (TPR) repeat protein
MSRMSIKIFVSSPGDVAQERFLTEKVITRLQNVFRHACKLEPIFWEHEPLTADKSFQEGLISPRETDIVICILWSRLGTRLPKHVTGGANLTGTEYEVTEAIEGRKQKGLPDLLVYRKTATAFADLSDRQRRVEALGQIEALETFIDKWFKNEEGALVAAFHPFERDDDFEQHVELHLRKLIESRLVAAGISAEDGLALKPTWMEGSPFRGLKHFDFKHEPIFFGRTKAIGEVVDRLKRQAEAGRAFLLVLGMSGSGKSSLIRAGVLPALSRPGVIEGVGLCRRAILRPGDGLGDVFDGLAAALLRKEALPELAHDGTTVDQLAQSLRDNPGAAAMLVKGAISQAAGVLTPASDGARQPQARMLFLVDQLEELFTNDKISDEDRSKFARLLTSLACNPLSQTWVIATLRSDFYASLAQVPELADLKGGLGQYDLLPPSAAETGLLVREPAFAAGLRFEMKPDGERLDDVLRDEAAQDTSLLPLLEFTLNELYDRRTDRGKLTFEAYQAIGGVKGALAQRAEATFLSLPQEVQRELPAVFRQLVTIGTLSDETPTSQRAPLERFAASPTRMLFVQKFIEARLLVSNHADGGASSVHRAAGNSGILRPAASDQVDDGAAFVRITHESLLARWERLQRWLADDREQLRVKARVEKAAALWLQEDKRSDLLLTAGKPLDEAEQLRAAKFELESEVQDLIEASRKKAHRNRRLRQAAIATLAALTLAASGLALLASIQRDKANRNAQLADQNAERAEAARREAVSNFQLARNAVDEYLTKIGRDSRLRARGLEPLRRELLLTARQFYDRFIEEKKGDADLEGARAEAYKHLGFITSEIDSKQAAIDLYAKALEAYTALVAGNPQSHSFRGDLGEVEYTLGWLYQAVGQLPSAEAACQAAVRDLGPIAAENPEIARYQKGLGAANSNLGMVDQVLGKQKDAEDAFCRARQIRAKLAAEHPDSDDYQSDLAKTNNNLGAFYQSAGRSEEAENQFQAALKIRRRLAVAHPEMAPYQRELARIYYNLGLRYENSRRFKEAEGMLTSAVDIDKRLSAEHPEVYPYQEALADGCRNLGHIYATQSLWNGAVQAYQQAADIYLQLASAHPEIPAFKARAAEIDGFLRDAKNKVAGSKSTSAGP